MLIRRTLTSAWKIAKLESIHIKSVSKIKSKDTIGITSENFVKSLNTKEKTFNFVVIFAKL